jgi:two-component system phosphate regulon sensor histidine kinase PhoR
VKKQVHTIRLIGLIVLVTIAIQVYWNYVQYVNNTGRVANDVQDALEQAVEAYRKSRSSESRSVLLDEELAAGEKADSVEAIIARVLQEIGGDPALSAQDPNTGGISYTIVSQTVALPELDSILQLELSRRNCAIDYNLRILEGGQEADFYGDTISSGKILKAQAEVFAVGSDALVELQFANPIWPSLLQGLTGIILSLILCSAVIYALYHLHRIIQKQKQLSEIKNDFISNVTHEFKTPIATVSSALEGIKSFNNEQLSEKTKRYLAISEQQLSKLNVLVEKVMETSLLESGQMSLEKERADMIRILEKCVEAMALNTSKTIVLLNNTDRFIFEVDPFHFENAITNLIDNAIKYGGDTITVSTEAIQGGLSIQVSDNGSGISKEAAPFIFDKFYREPGRSTQSIKGFGIGLFYTKRVIELHGGTIELRNSATFTIQLWKP